MTSRTAPLRILLLAAAACVNLAAGAILSLHDPARASDLWTMYEWCRGWLIHGESLYRGSAAVVDYPPNAIVMLSPLALVPRMWVVPLWTVLSLALIPFLPWIVTRLAAPSARSAIAAPLLLFLCWTSARTLLQFSVLSITFAMCALSLADSRPLASGVLLGLALSKPHIAGPIALWMMATRRFRALLVSMAAIGAGWGIYDLRIGENPLTTVAGYGRVLRSLYLGADGLAGRTSIRAWTLAVVSDPRIADAIWIGASVLVIAVVWILARRDPRRPLHAGGMAIPGLFCLCSLLAIYHNVNNLLLMLPAFAFLWFHDGPRRSWRRWLPIVVLQLALMLDIPTRVGPLVTDRGWLTSAVESADRLVVLATFLYVAAVWIQLTRPAPATVGVPTETALIPRSRIP
jgi:hypothetical protein